MCWWAEPLERWTKKIAESGFDPPTSGLWAQHASSAPPRFRRLFYRAKDYLNVAMQERVVEVVASIFQVAGRVKSAMLSVVIWIWVHLQRSHWNILVIFIYFLPAFSHKIDRINWLSFKIILINISIPLKPVFHNPIRIEFIFWRF